MVKNLSENFYVTLNFALIPIISTTICFQDTSYVCR